MSSMRIKAILVCLFAVISCTANAVDTLVLWKRNYDTPFFYAVVKNAAELTRDDYGDYSIVASPPMEQGRAFISLAKDELLNIAIAGSSLEKESQGRAIYFPLDRGVLGFRVCMTRRGVADFSDVSTIKQFNQKGYTIGVGTHWPDRTILEFNKFIVAHTPVYENLFRMLKAKRFDCFLRSVQEVSDELIRFDPHQQLTVENKFAIVYPLADFIYVSNQQTRLYERLQVGIERSVQDGSFAALFEKHIQPTLDKYAFSSREYIMLPNPDLSLEALKAINKYGMMTYPDSFAVNAH